MAGIHYTLAEGEEEEEGEGERARKGSAGAKIVHGLGASVHEGVRSSAAIVNVITDYNGML